MDNFFSLPELSQYELFSMGRGCYRCSSSASQPSCHKLSPLSLQMLLSLHMSCSSCVLQELYDWGQSDQ